MVTDSEIQLDSEFLQHNLQTKSHYKRVSEHTHVKE